LVLIIVILLHLWRLLLDRLHLHVIILLHWLQLLIHLIYLWINILIHGLLTFSSKIFLVKYDLIINHFVIFYQKINKKILVNLEILKDANLACTIIKKEHPIK